MQYSTPKAALMANNVPWIEDDIFSAIYGAERIEKLSKECNLHPVRIDLGNFERELPALQDLEVIFSCWGMLPLTTEQLNHLPNLKAVFFAGGSITGFAAALLARDIIICNGVEANAIPVAEFCLGQILLSAKGAWRNSLACRQGPWDQAKMPIGPGAYGAKVAIVGVGAISRHLLKLLGPINLKIMAHSNYLSDDNATELGIDELCDIETCFREAIIVSNHLADKPSNQGIIGKSHFESMREGATFINTGRGAQVDESAMIEVLKVRPDLTALLDVQHPEPPRADSEFYTLPNVHMTSHIAGSMNDELKRMADFVIEDFFRWKTGSTLKYQIDPTSLTQRA
jgi:phosphoglycerate dehydrogenase-like enzyme